jgi:hypothetical protein
VVDVRLRDSDRGRRPRARRRAPRIHRRSHHRPDTIGFAASALRGAPSSRIHAHVPHRRRHGGSPAPAPQRAGTATKLRLLTDAG